MKGFAFTVDDTRLDQGNDPIGEHFGVNPQVAVAFKKRPDRIGNATNPHLKGGAILNEARHMFPNLYLDVSHRVWRQFKQRRIASPPECQSCSHG